MKKVIYVAPFVRSRYKGGIARIAEYLNQNEAVNIFNRHNVEVEFFNSHYLDQSKNSEGKLRYENIKQAMQMLINEGAPEETPKLDQELDEDVPFSINSDKRVKALWDVLVKLEDLRAEKYALEESIREIEELEKFYGSE